MIYCITIIVSSTLNYDHATDPHWIWKIAKTLNSSENCIISLAVCVVIISWRRDSWKIGESHFAAVTNYCQENALQVSIQNVKPSQHVWQKQKKKAKNILHVTETGATGSNEESTGVG